MRTSTSNNLNAINVEFIPKFQHLWRAVRFKIYYGGRGGLKSWSFARALLIKAIEKPLLIACCREYQVNIGDSVHRLLCNQIELMNLTPFFNITKHSISSYNGSEFIFMGLHHNASGIKSLEGVDICWVEEAESVSKESWNILEPTIRKPGSEIWVSFNPGRESDETYQRFIVNPKSNSVVVKVSLDDNPWATQELLDARDELYRVDPDMAAHVWGGEPLTYSNAQIFKGKYSIADFNTPDWADFYHGADWGFGPDPATLIRCFVHENTLFVDYELYGHAVEIDAMPEWYRAMPTSQEWAIYGDNSQPATISYMRRMGYNIRAAKKWSGSVMDGIRILRQFDNIVIHPRCKHTIEEFKMYSYKVDKITEEIQPIIVDKYNHCIDAIRYGLDRYIRRRAGINIKDTL